MNIPAAEPADDAVQLRFLHYLAQVYPPEMTQRRFSLVLSFLLVGFALCAASVFVALRGDLWALLILPVALALIGRSAVALYRLRSNERYFLRLRRIAERGRFVQAYLVQVNREKLTKASEQTIPCRVLFTFDAGVERDTEYMRYLAGRVYQLIGKGPLAADDLGFLENPAPAAPPPAGGRRRQLPLTLTDGSIVYCGDLWVKRAYLKSPFLPAEPLPCVAEPEPDGGVELVPSWLVPQMPPPAQSSGAPQGSSVWG